jgi:hypothetical protein
MQDHEIKKLDWENHFLKHISELGHPIVPGEASLKNYKLLIEKYVKGKKALLFGATWQLRDLLAEMGFEVTVVDISKEALDTHSMLCKIKGNERLIQCNWLDFNEGKYDVILGDDCNIQLKEESYDAFFSNIKNLLNDEGVSIQIIEGAHKDERSSLKDVINFIKNSSIDEIKDHKNRAYYYLSYALYVNNNEFKNLAQIEHDLKPFIGKEITQEQYDNFILGAVNFSAAVLPVDLIDLYIEKHLNIIEKMPASETYVEKCFYWLYVMKK